MARYCGAVCRLCRREGEKLFLKGERCFTSKCAIERREGGPGQHGKGRQAFSDYKIQLRAKQKTKRIYDVSEKALRKYYTKAAKARGVTGTELLRLLELRLINVVHRAGFAASHRAARQLISHGFVLVNGRRVNLGSVQVSAGDVIEVHEKAKNWPSVQAAMAATESRLVPAWLSLDRAGAKATVLAVPDREQMPSTVNEQLIVELYSR